MPNAETNPLLSHAGARGEGEPTAPVRAITPAQLVVKPAQQGPTEQPADYGAWPWVAAGAAVVFAGTALGTGHF
jgi:hypothetical protein